MNQNAHIAIAPLGTPQGIAAKPVVEAPNRLPLSQPAQAEVEKKVADYKSSLMADAEAIANRHSADNISAADVAQAASNLAHCPSRKTYKHVGATGWALTGAALGQFLTMVGQGTPSMPNTFLTCGAFVIGCTLVAVAAAKAH